MVGVSGKEGRGVFRRRKTRRWPRKRGRLYMSCVIDMVRSSGYLRDSVCDIEGDRTSAQLRTMERRNGHVAPLNRRGVRVRLVRRVKGRGQFGGDGQLAGDAVGDKLRVDVRNGTGVGMAVGLGRGLGV
jgi:hypothetical protein